MGRDLFNSQFLNTELLYHTIRRESTFSADFSFLKFFKFFKQKLKKLLKYSQSFHNFKI